MLKHVDMLFGLSDVDVERLRAMRRRSGNLPYGYHYVRSASQFIGTDQIEPDSNEADVVRTVFRMRATGATLQAIASALNQNGCDASAQ